MDTDQQNLNPRTAVDTASAPPPAIDDADHWGCESAMPYLTIAGGAQWFEHGGSGR